MNSITTDYSVRAQLFAPRTQQEFVVAARQMRADGHSDSTISHVLKISLDIVRAMLGPEGHMSAPERAGVIERRAHDGVLPRYRTDVPVVVSQCGSSGGHFTPDAAGGGGICRTCARWHAVMSSPFHSRPRGDAP